MDARTTIRIAVTPANVARMAVLGIARMAIVMIRTMLRQDVQTKVILMIIVLDKI